jgi:hypothetical protein
VSPGRLLSTAGWGIYLSCSWTWCIGMYLPVILLRDLGWPALLAFAVPNVFGAAAFGYVVRSGARSAALIDRHRPAMRWFSITAIAYHAFFCAFLVAILSPDPPWAAVIAGAAVIAAGLLLSFLPAGSFPILAVIVYCLSLAVFVALGTAHLFPMSARGAQPAERLVWLAPVMAFGFLLCPYLDLTFHRAIDRSPSRHAFAVFAVGFSVMLLLTCAYRDHIVLAAVPLAHIGAQSAFTAGAHLRELRRRGGPPAGRTLGLALAVAAAAALLVLALGDDPKSNGEAVYVRFLVFFGLIFPAWVLLFMGPGRPLSLTRRHVLIYAAAMVVSLPFYEAGFLHGHMWLTAIPLAALLMWAAAAHMNFKFRI